MRELSVEELRVFAKGAPAPLVDGLSFTLLPGASLILLGQSGCGKTMTCRAVMGLLDRRAFRTEGRAVFDGTELLGLPEKRRADFYGSRIAFIPQNPMTALDPSVTVGRQMTESLRQYTGLSAQRRRRALEALERAGLEDADRVFASRPDMLSGGMLQRVLIAMALSTDAELVVADEPTTALDVVHRNETVDAFIGLRNSGAAVLFVTHDFAAATRLGGEILVMKDGAAVERGRTEDVYARPETEYARALVRASALSKERRAGHADR